jgi:hypothetical protein
MEKMTQIRQITPDFEENLFSKSPDFSNNFHSR